MRIKIVSKIEPGAKECPACLRSHRKPGKTPYCGACEIWLDCKFCGEEFKVDQNNFKRVIEEPDKPRACSNACSNKEISSRNILCDIHGFQEKTANLNCIECKLEKLHESIFCDIHGFQEKSFSKRCIICLHQKAEYHYSFCDYCGEETEHFGRRCYKHNKREEAGFIKSSWRYESPECPIHPYESKQALRHSSYECWACVKESFSIQDSLELEIPGSFWQATYRAENSSSVGQFMMEEELVERSVGWFAYLKGYIRDHQWLPLVVGKTGSKLVNKSGTDIQFSVNGDSFARVFLRESALSWDTSKILVIPCDTEEEALIAERSAALEFNLFES